MTVWQVILIVLGVMVGLHVAAVLLGTFLGLVSVWFKR